MIPHSEKWNVWRVSLLVPYTSAKRISAVEFLRIREHLSPHPVTPARMSSMHFSKNICWDS
jgi:hypothetical protein